MTATGGDAHDAPDHELPDRLRDVDLQVPTRVVFAAGALDRLGELTRPHGSRALLVTGRSAARAYGYLDRAVESLATAGMTVTVQDLVSANPRSDEVDAAAAAARRHGCDVVVGLGGGSAVDAAKATAAAVGAGTSVRELIGTTLDPATPVLPVVAVPTTAGSGSEVTKGAIITDTERRFRSGVRGEALFPRTALIDPALVASVPLPVVAETAFAAFAHAVEGCVAAQATALSRRLGHRAIGLVAEHLPAALRGATTAATRDGLCMAALLGGVNVATVSTCLPHRLQQAMGALPGLGISHGRGLAVLYPAWLRHTAPLAPGPFQDIAAVLGAGDVHTAVEGLLKSSGLSARLGAFGVTRDDLPVLVASVSGDLANDPAGEAAAGRLQAIYADAL